MAVSDDHDAPDAAQDAGQDFLDRSYLTYIVPSATDFQLKKALETTVTPYRHLFSSIESREWLFFGTRSEQLLRAVVPHCLFVDLQMRASTYS